MLVFNTVNFTEKSGKYSAFFFDFKRDLLLRKKQKQRMPLRESRRIQVAVRVEINFIHIFFINGDNLMVFYIIKQSKARKCSFGKFIGSSSIDCYFPWRIFDFHFSSNYTLVGIILKKGRVEEEGASFISALKAETRKAMEGVQQHFQRRKLNVHGKCSMERPFLPQNQ